MPDALIRPLIEAVHSSPAQAVLYLSGGASQALGWLMSVPGASNTVLETVVPYSKMSMTQLLGKIPTHFTSQQTVEDMALLAYNRALKLCRPGHPVVGMGFTGSLASSHPKLGDHRFYLSTRTCDRHWVSKVTLSKGLRTREQEDKVSSHLLIKALADACKVSASFVTELNDSEVPDESEVLFDEDQELQQLLDGQICMKVYPFSDETNGSSSERKIILSGSFNPLHDGHLKLLEVATRKYVDIQNSWKLENFEHEIVLGLDPPSLRLLSMPIHLLLWAGLSGSEPGRGIQMRVNICGDGYPCFEISAVNADKPPLTVSQIKDRVKQFRKVGKTIIISNQPYFYKKAELFPGSAFVIGADTATRLVDPKYYGGDHSKMLDILLGCKRTGCTFLVGGRNFDGAFKVLEDIDIPEELREMFISIPEEKFRMDISSTEIRKRLGM